MTIRALCTAMLLAAAVLTGCGEEEPADSSSAEAVEAQEQNTVELDGVRYRVVIFRQLNPRIAPDKALYEGAPPDGDSGIFAAFVQACNVSQETQRPAERVRLEDAFGEEYRRLEAASTSAYDFDAARLRPGECVPAEDTVANRALPGAAILFEVPFDKLGNRPFVLELRDRGVRRIELDV